MTIFANCHLWNVSVLTWIGMTVRLVTISAYDMLLRLITLVALNHLVLGAFKVKEVPFFYIIVLFDLFLPFSFQQLGCFFLCRCFHGTHVIVGYKHFTCHIICFHTRAVVSTCFCLLWWNTDDTGSMSDRLNYLGTILESEAGSMSYS